MEEYCPVPLAKIKPLNALPADVFVKINEKYIRFKYEKDHIDNDKYDLFLAKKTDSLYVTKNQLKTFLDWIEELRKKEIDEIVGRVGDEHRSVVEQQQSIKEELFDSFAKEEISEKSVVSIKEATNRLVSGLKAKKSNAKFLAHLVTFSPLLADHSLNVANLSIFLALNLEQQHSLVLEKVFLGGLYHDYGKVLIPAKVFENKNSATYINAMTVHATMGFNALNKIKGMLPEQVLSIVAQHHEQFNGEGVPNKLKADQIYGLTKIVAIANIFDNIVTEDRLKAGGKVDIYKRAFKILEMDRGRIFDPTYLETAYKALQDAYMEGTLHLR